MIQDLIHIIKHAGEEILKFREMRDFILKNDKSPLTLADQASHLYLCKSLLQIKNIPILSEEREIEFKMRKNWEEFWIIDPLDGTKEFIRGLNDFCINIALIQGEKPVLGIIYAPKLGELYCAQKAGGFEYNGPTLERIIESANIVAVSRYHHSTLTKQFIELNGLKHINTLGSALKFGRMALGQIDLYPRFEGSKQWDTAAGQIILAEAKCSIVDLVTKKIPAYNQFSLKNNYFIAARPHINLKQLQYPSFL